jgi:histidinol-phosphate aminotransferase
VLVGAGTSLLKLDANESTIAPSPLVRERVDALLASGAAAAYPDPDAALLRGRLAEYASRPVEQVLPYNGCDVAIDSAVRVFASRGDRVTACAPCYDRFRACAQNAGLAVTHALSDDPYRTNVGRLLDAIDGTTRLVYISNPNNPTGRVYTLDEVAVILTRLSGGVLLLDETYFEFAGMTVASLIDRFDNLIVLRSFSKAFGLAGARCGYTLGADRVTQALRRIWTGRDVNAMAQVAAVAALDDLPYMQRYVDEVTDARSWLVDALVSLGFEARGTPANFVLLRVTQPAQFLARLRAEGIVIRDRSELPQLAGMVRVSVGTFEQCRRVVDTIAALPVRFQTR